MRKLILTMGLLSVCWSAQAQSLMSGLVSHWKLDGPVSGVWPDSHGTNDLFDNFGAFVDPGKLGNSVRSTFDGAYLSVPSNSTLQTGETDFTFTFWFKPHQDQILFLFSKQDDTGIDYACDYNSLTRSVVFYINVGSASAEIPGTVEGVWHFVVCRFHAPSFLGSIEVSVDNGPFNSSWIGQTVSTSGEFEIGAAFGGTGFADVDIDSVSFWKRAITDAEASQLWNGGAGLDYPFE